MWERTSVYSVNDPALTFPPLVGGHHLPPPRRIHLEGIETIQSLSFPTQLCELTVVFNNFHKAPLMKDLTFTPCAGGKLDVSIYYHDKVPSIENVKVIRSSPFSGCIDSSLTLCHLPSLPGHLTSQLPTHPDEGRNFGYLQDFFYPPEWGPHELLFGTLKVIGGPSSIMESIGKVTKTVFDLYWKQTSPPKDHHHQITIHADYMRCFSFESLIKKAKFPTLVSFTSIFLRSLNIRSYHGINLSTLQQIPECFTTLRILVDTPDVDDYASSIDDIWRILMVKEYNSSTCLSRVCIVGLKRSPNVSQEQIDGFLSRTISKSMRQASKFELLD